MTRWERFYRWLGGVGPGEVRAAPEQWGLLASNVARALKWLGFIYRQPGPEGDWFVNFRWQWRFWRGAYWAVLERNAARAALWHQWSSLRRGIVARIDPDFTSWVQDEHGWFWGNRRPGDTPPAGLLHSVGCVESRRPVAFFGVDAAWLLTLLPGHKHDKEPTP
jgi:hypothetical protein